MDFVDILPALITLFIAGLGGLITFNRQQVRFDGRIDLLKQQLSSEKERVDAEIIALKIVNDHFSRSLDHTKEELSAYKGDIREIKTNIEYIREALKDIRDRKS